MLESTPVIPMVLESLVALLRGDGPNGAGE
jgi:hypothetical protein